MRFEESPRFGVKEMARFLGVSDRRVRALLAQGRIAGYKRKGGMWEVIYPLRILPGRRGPDLKGYPARRLKATKAREGTPRQRGGAPPSPVSTQGEAL